MVMQHFFISLPVTISILQSQKREQAYSDKVEQLEQAHLEREKALLDRIADLWSSFSHQNFPAAPPETNNNQLKKGKREKTHSSGLCFSTPLSLTTPSEQTPAQGGKYAGTSVLFPNHHPDQSIYLSQKDLHFIMKHKSRGIHLSCCKAEVEKERKRQE